MFDTNHNVLWYILITKQLSFDCRVLVDFARVLALSVAVIFCGSHFCGCHFCGRDRIGSTVRLDLGLRKIKKQVKSVVVSLK